MSDVVATPDPDHWHIRFRSEQFANGDRVRDECVITDDAGHLLGGGTLIHAAYPYPELQVEYRIRLVDIAARDVAAQHRQRTNNPPKE